MSKKNNEITEEMKIVKITPFNPIKLPRAAISLISPPPRASFLRKNLKITASKKNSRNPNPAPIKAERNGTSLPGNSEKMIPIKISGRDKTSGMILWKKSIKKMIEPIEKRIKYFR